MSGQAWAVAARTGGRALSGGADSEYLFLYLAHGQAHWHQLRADDLPAAWEIFHRSDPSVEVLVVHRADPVWKLGDPEPSP